MLVVTFSPSSGSCHQMLLLVLASSGTSTVVVQVQGSWIDSRGVEVGVGEKRGLEGVEVHAVATIA